MEAQIVEIGPGWSLKNLSCDPPKIIVRVYESSGGSTPILRASGSESSGDYTELDLSKLCTYPTMDEGDNYKVLMYFFKDGTHGFSKAEVDIDLNTDLPTAVYLTELYEDPYYNDAR